MTTTRETMPVVPDGKILIANCGTYDRALNADTTLIASAVGTPHGYPTVTLTHVTRGYVDAGSCARWSEARWRVLWMAADGAILGRSFREEDEAGARAYFAQLTDPQAVSAMRQRDAMRADMEREARAEADVKLATVKVEAAKTYKSGWQYRADWPGYRSWCGYAKTKTAALAQCRAALHREFFAECMGRLADR